MSGEHPRGLSRRELAAIALLALAGSLAMLWLKAWNVSVNDYAEEARGPLTALLHGHISLFLETAPSYGASLELRAPFALIPSLANAGARTIYRFAALPCLLAAAGLGVWIAPRLRLAGRGWLSVVVALAVCVANPLTYYALLIGHPEDLLGGVLCVAAVLSAIRGHASWAGVLLGAAIANKAWALLAIGPVLIALPAHHWRAALAATAVAAVLLAPIVLTSGTIASGSERIGVSDGGSIFYPQQVWWFFGTPGHWVPSMAGEILRGYRWPPSWLAGRAHLLIVWLGVPLTLIAARRRMARETALLLLALLFLLRCMLDPWDLVYYPLPLVLALLAWETTVRRRMPLGALAVSVAAAAIFRWLPPYLSANQQALSFIIPSVLMLLVIAPTVYRRPAERVPPPAFNR
ncbi:MAG: glycosyltransferase 87 family protein [Solirubrobacteraceae bacterium]